MQTHNYLYLLFIRVHCRVYMGMRVTTACLRSPSSQMGRKQKSYRRLCTCMLEIVMVALLHHWNQGLVKYLKLVLDCPHLIN